MSFALNIHTEKYFSLGERLPERHLLKVEMRERKVTSLHARPSPTCDAFSKRTIIVSYYSPSKGCLMHKRTFKTQSARVQLPSYHR